MKIGILGTGMVGQALGTGFVAAGHAVMLGAREAANPRAAEWAQTHAAQHGNFADAARFGELLVNATAGRHSVEALQLAGERNLQGKILIDVANPLDFSQGMPPTLTICNTESLGERIQAHFPSVKVVKALNTVNCELMLQPGKLSGEHDLFICGDDTQAKERVTELLRSFGWQHVHDLGGIANARGTEMLLALWIRLMQALGTPLFNFHVVR